jgi:hypothetical protein
MKATTQTWLDALAFWACHKRHHHATRSSGGQMTAKLRQHEARDKAYITKQQPNKKELVGNGRFFRKLQTHKVFDEMTVTFLNSEKSQKFTIS